MTEPSLLSQLPGGAEVIAWFGHVPRFHDAEISGIHFEQGKAGSIRLYAWNMTREVDENGYFVLEKHATVDIRFASVDVIDLRDFDFGTAGIIMHLDFFGSPAVTEVRWDSSYGVEGRVVGRGVSLKVTPDALPRES